MKKKSANVYIIFFSLLMGFFFTACKKEKPKDKSEPINMDVALVKVSIPFLSRQGEQIPIKGTIRNLRDTEINRLEIKWQVDQGQEHSAVYENLQLKIFEEFVFEHPDIYTATTGNHSIKVWISQFNDNEEDAEPLNNSITTELKVPSQEVQHIVLYEEFTSSTCNPCYYFNTYYFNEAYFNYNQGKFNLIKYQMNWPGSGDIYYTAEGGIRRDFYGVNAVPTLFIDGEEGDYSTASEMQQDLDEHYALPGTFDIEAYYTITTSNEIKVKVTGTPFISGQYKMYIAVVEKETTGNVGSNGEDKFFNVMMKMVPHANGVSINVTDGTSFTEKHSASLNGTNIEEYSDLEIVVFIQDENNKFVYQSTTAINDASQIDF